MYVETAEREENDVQDEGGKVEKRAIFAIFGFDEFKVSAFQS